MKLLVSHCHQQLHPAHLSLKRDPVGQSHDSESAKKRMQERSGNHTQVVGPPSEEQETEATTHKGSPRLDNRRWKMSPGLMTHKFCPDIPTVGSEAKQHQNMGQSCLVSKVHLRVVFGGCFHGKLWVPCCQPGIVRNPQPIRVLPSFSRLQWTDLMPTSSRIRQLKLLATMPLWTNFCFRYKKKLQLNICREEWR